MGFLCCVAIAKRVADGAEPTGESKAAASTQSNHTEVRNLHENDTTYTL
jgi:hypothetical protein